MCISYGIMSGHVIFITELHTGPARAYHSAKQCYRERVMKIYYLCDMGQLSDMRQ